MGKVLGGLVKNAFRVNWILGDSLLLSALAGCEQNVLFACLHGATVSYK